MLMEKLIQDIYTCSICQRIALPPVKWNTVSPDHISIPKCNHIYCLECTETYFKMERRKTSCLICQRPLAPFSEEQYHFCSYDEDNIINLLQGKEERKCHLCNFKTNDSFLMKEHYLKTCENALHACKFHKNGCSEKLKLNENHECSFRSIKCKLCKNIFMFRDLNLHLNIFHHISTEEVKMDNLFSETNEQINLHYFSPIPQLLGSDMFLNSFTNFN